MILKNNIEEISLNENGIILSYKKKEQTANFVF